MLIPLPPTACLQNAGLLRTVGRKECSKKAKCNQNLKI